MWSKCVLVLVYTAGYYCQVWMKEFPKNTQISNFMKIRPVWAELFHTDGRTDGRTVEQTDEAVYSPFEILRTRLKASQFVLCTEIMAVCTEIHTKHINTAVWAERRIAEC